MALRGGHIARAGGRGSFCIQAAGGCQLDITSMPGTEFLTAQERELCAHHRFLPSFYLSLKAAFLREAAQRPQGAIPRSDARTLFRLEPAKAMHIYELMQRTGWLRAAPQRTRGAPTATPLREPIAPGGWASGTRRLRWSLQASQLAAALRMQARQEAAAFSKNPASDRWVSDRQSDGHRRPFGST
ncbi:hypothetical protein WJX84_005571 [Apatococcus fuscideae]|uniref:SWIRM domain-containing protein n=1 Tax=Apatococcus fuscideae TaxID=2026836 RepID=A0AAW1SZ46_9CHLO